MSVTRLLKRNLVEHDVSTVAEAGFRGLKNGALLRAASGSYDVLITVDQNLPYQQNIRDLRISVVVVLAGGISYKHLQPLVPQILDAVKTAKSGQITTVQTA
jgi:hypothetical protein